MGRRQPEPPSRRPRAGRYRTLFWPMAALLVLLPACDKSIEVSDERGYWENVEDEEPDLSSLRRADLALTSSVVDVDGNTFTVSGSLVSLDRSFVIGPVVAVELSDGVTMDPVPAECTMDGTSEARYRFDCRFAATLEINASPPTEPISFQLSLVVAEGAAGPSVTLTASSASNSVDNDPDPSNNTVTHLLT